MLPLIKNRYFELFIVFLFFLVLSGLVIFSNDKIFDYDSLYHLKHALLYRTEGITFSNFPWVQFSSINSLKSDLWYGFHLFLIPFSFFSDPLFGIRLSSLFFSAFLFSSFFFILKSLRVKFSVFFTLLLFFSSGDFIFRSNMSRPHTLTLALFALLLLFLSNKSFIKSFFVSFLVSFIHASLFWVSFLIFFIVFLVEIWQEKKIYWLSGLSVFLGSFLGFILRPNPFGSLKLVYIQIVDIIFAKGIGAPLNFGRELLPLTFSDVYFQFLPLFLVFLIVIFFFFKFIFNRFLEIRMEERIVFLSSFFLSVIFVLLSFFVARRSNDFFSVFIIISAALGFSFFFKKNWQYSLKVILFSLFSFFLLISASRSVYVFSLFIKNSEPADKFKEVSLWLKENTNKGEIVFHSYWDNFPNLFFWNDHNYYISGMDPIFQYSFNESLFWKNYFIAYRGEPFTCGSIRCTKEMVEDVYSVLKNDFHASFFVLEYRRSPNFIKNIENLSGFEKVFSTDKEVVYKIN
ncbi:MAG: hypothetical protein PHZ25_01610 [Candidatus Pacebacteria bacterium]|nr:hypothetical protein [Candidatus Paceibacterota bacterium]